MGQFKHPNVIQLTGVVTVGKCKCASFSGIYQSPERLLEACVPKLHTLGICQTLPIIYRRTNP